MLWKWRESSSARLTEALAAVHSPKSWRKPQRPTYETSAVDQALQIGHAAFTCVQLSLPPARGPGRQVIAHRCPVPAALGATSAPLEPMPAWRGHDSRI